MKRIMAAAIAAASLVVIEPGPVRAAGEPPCDSSQNAGAAPGQKLGTSEDMAVKKQADAEKYQTAGANSAKEACEKAASQAKGASPGQKQ